MLTPEREQEIRGQVDYGEDAGYTPLGWERAARDLLAEIDRLRALYEQSCINLGKLAMGDPEAVEIARKFRDVAAAPKGR